jgi:hypothetical protein
MCVEPHQPFVVSLRDLADDAGDLAYLHSLGAYE